MPVMIGTAVLTAFFSAVLASFFMTIAYRAVTGQNWRACLGGRSRCDSCGRLLAARDMIPVFSFLALRGGCRYCAAPVGMAVFGAEAVSFLLGMVSAFLLRGDDIVLAAVLGAALSALAVCDWRSGFLPDILTFPLLLAGFFLSLAGMGPPPEEALIGAVAGFAALRLVALIYRWARGREGLGGGDAWLLAAAGAWLGWRWLALVVLLGALGTLVGALLWHILARRRLNATAELPLGPGLCAAVWLCWLLARG